jgi:hypothetical protein
MKDLEESLLNSEIAKTLKENNPKAFKRYKRLERGNFFYRIGSYFFGGISALDNFFNSNYDFWKDLYN